MATMNPIGDREGVVTKFGPDSWIVGGVFDSEQYAPPAGYVAVFQSPSDCLDWLRHSVFDSDDPYFQGEHDELIANLIDNAPKDEPPEKTIERALAVSEVSGQFRIEACMSIQEYMDEVGSVQEWREAFSDESIDCDEGEWTGSPEFWARLGKQIRNEDNGGELTFDLEVLCPQS